MPSGIKKNLDLLYCEQCTTKFLSPRSHAKYCNVKCRVAAHRDRVKENTPTKENYGGPRQVRIDVIKHYSNGEMKCVCCGTEGLVFLCLDHINGDGNEHRKEIGQGINVYYWVKRNNFPDGFQVLCYNCNIAKRDGEFCPHQNGSHLIY